ncbi:MAG: hypothetical protein ACLVL7_13500 [Anaerotruncus massiliensis (ex Togo et al. 2019)]
MEYQPSCGARGGTVAAPYGTPSALPLFSAGYRSSGPRSAGATTPPWQIELRTISAASITQRLPTAGIASTFAPGLVAQNPSPRYRAAYATRENADAGGQAAKGEYEDHGC